MSYGGQKAEVGFTRLPRAISFGEECSADHLTLVRQVIVGESLVKPN
jgi:hypothetical protein